MIMRFILFALFFSSAGAAGAELELQGTYERRTDAYSRQVLGDAVCFVVDERFESRLPRPAGDERRPWFCFSNVAQAMKAFALSPGRKGCGMRGPATITVSGYALAKGDGEAVDRARLERVLAKGAPRPIPCSE
jgi:hypothetical protein